MINTLHRDRRAVSYSSWLFVLAVGTASVWQSPAVSQEQDNPVGEWRYIGGNAAHTRFTALDQINAQNFNDLEIAWVWRGDNFGPQRQATRNTD